MSEDNQKAQFDEVLALTVLALAWKVGKLGPATDGIDVQHTGTIDALVDEFVAQLEPEREWVYQGLVSDRLRRKVEFAYTELQRDASMRATELIAVVSKRSSS